MYAYLINKEGYDHEYIKAYKSLEGCRLFWYSHELKLMKNKNLFSGYHYVKLGVKPTERENDGWIIIQSDGSAHTAHCPCTGGVSFLLPRLIFHLSPGLTLYCLISTSYLAGLFDIFILLYI